MRPAALFILVLPPLTAWRAYDPATGEGGERA